MSEGKSEVTDVWFDRATAMDLLNAKEQLEVRDDEIARLRALVKDAFYEGWTIGDDPRDINQDWDNSVSKARLKPSEPRNTE